MNKLSEKKDLKRMCDHCFQIVDADKVYGFVVIDDYGFKRGFKGHEDCVQIMIEKLREIFPKREDENHEQ